MPRCPNGTRRNKKTGKCEPKKSPKNKTVKSKTPSPVKSKTPSPKSGKIKRFEMIDTWHHGDFTMHHYDRDTIVEEVWVDNKTGKIYTYEIFKNDSENYNEPFFKKFFKATIDKSNRVSQEDLREFKNNYSDKSTLKTHYKELKVR